MPRLNHKKARTGCVRCKARKVKCDEARPKCTACARHGVSCDYLLTAPSSHDATPAGTVTPPPIINFATDTYGPDHGFYGTKLDALLELRLMHEWTAYVCETFTTSWEFYRYQAPLIALEYRHVLDSMLAMAALHASRQPLKQWVPSEHRMVPIDEIAMRLTQPPPNGNGQWKLEGMDADFSKQVTSSGNKAWLNTKCRDQMLTVSRFYFDRAIEGHRKALDDLSVENIESVYMTSILVSFHAVFVLSESEEDTTLPSLDPLQWMRLAKGTRFICARWYELVGPSWLHQSGVFYGTPDLTDATKLYDTEHGKPFLKLLTWAEDFETITPEDRLVYQNVISYVGAVYTGISEGSEGEMASCRRIIATPSRNDPRFIDLLEAKQPRAWAIMAHLFACMKLIANKVTWFEGIAERQIPRIQAMLPTGWMPMLAWPLAIMNGEIDREPKETYIEDILSL